MTSPPIRRRDLLASGGALMVAGPAASEVSLHLRDRAAQGGRLYGAAIESERVDGDPAFAALVRAQCGLITPENAMKWNALRPSPLAFDFRSADRVVEIARAQRAAVHGHCLVWHDAMPAWLTRTLGSGLAANDARQFLTDHIHRVAGRYAGVVRSWDVVNEAVERNDGRPDGLRDSLWLKTIGPDYIPLAFHAARAADPHARLALADYGLEYDDEPWMEEKRATMLRILSSLKRAHAPIDALAIQGHLIGDRPPAFGDGLRRFLGEVAAIGLEIYITELDVDDRNLGGTVRDRDMAVAAIYARFLETVLGEPAVRSVVTWGLSDRYTSRAQFFPRPDGDLVRPLPFDRALAPKPAAFAIAAALKRRA